MWKATLRGILARKVRLALTALAVLLGVSFVSGTYVLTDTLDRSFEGFFQQTVAGVDLVVRLRAPFDANDIERQRFPDTVLETVRGVDGVASAGGFVQGYAQFVDKDGDDIQNGGAPTFGLSWDQPHGRGPLRLVHDGKSRAPRTSDEVTMDVGTARRHGFHVGDRVRVLLQGPARQFRIVGLFGFGNRFEALAVTFAAFDLKTAERVLGTRDRLDAINVITGRGVSTAQLQQRLQAAVGDTYDVTPAAHFAEDRSRNVRDFFSLLTQLLLGFAAIGLVVGAFIIFNTFTILVTQRTHELGLMRAMGATGRQVITSVVAEAAVIGGLASAAGLALGIGLAAALLALVEALGFDVPSGALIVLDRTVVVALAVGIVVTVASSVVPAIRAARIPPIAAINDVFPVRARPFRVRAVVGALLVAGGVPLLLVGIDRSQDAHDVTSEIWLVAVGALLLFFGAVVLLATFARPLAGALGWPARAVGITGNLARGNAMRNPRRTAATASALVIGLGLVGLVAIFGDSAKASVRAAVDRGIRADLVLKAQQFAGFSPQVARRVARFPDVEAVAAFRFGNVRVNGDEETFVGVNPNGLARTVDLRMRRGSIGDLGRDGVLVFRDAARRYHVEPGDTLEVQFPQGFQTMRVVGIYGQQDFTGGFPISFIVGKHAYEMGFGTDDQDQLVYAATRGDPEAARSTVEDALRHDFPNIDVFTRDGYRDEQERAIDRFLAVTVALLLLSEIIAVLGIVNTLALSVFERTHELGLLRSVGMSRRQLRRMIRGESVIVALIGGLIGTVIGLVWGWAFTTALETQGITTVSVPAWQLALFVALSMVAGVVAAVAPAWRASRLDVLAAIATE